MRTKLKVKDHRQEESKIAGQVAVRDFFLCPEVGAADVFQRVNNESGKEEVAVIRVVNLMEGQLMWMKSSEAVVPIAKVELHLFKGDVHE